MLKIRRIDYQAYQSLGTGKLAAQIENGAAAGKNILFDFAFNILRRLIPSVLFSMLFIFRINKYIMFSVIFGYVFVFIITNLLLRLLYSLKEKILTNEEKFNHYLVRGFMEMVVFRINRKFDAEITRVSNSKDEIISAKVEMKLIHEAFFASFALLVILIKIQ